MNNKLITITSNLSLEIVKDGSDTIIYLSESNDKRILYIYYPNKFNSFLYDDTYIVIYTKDKYHKLNLEVAYNYKTKRLVNLSNNKLRYLLEYRFLLKQCFDLRVILSFINQIDLKLISSPNELINLKDFLTSGNSNITNQEIIEYILKNYPILKRYTNLTQPLYVTDYLKIIEDIGHESLYFHIMPIKEQLLTK